jgi:hypothetical protein
MIEIDVAPYDDVQEPLPYGRINNTATVGERLNM